MKTGFYFLTEQNVTELIGKRIEFRAPGAWENGNYGGVAVIKAVDLNQRFPLTVEHVSGDDLKYAFLDDHGLEPLADGKGWGMTAGPRCFSYSDQFREVEVRPCE